MQYILGHDWRDVFDVIIVQARKPKFFTDTNRPFRLYDLETQAPVWDKICHLEKGKVYCEVTQWEVYQLNSVKHEIFTLIGNRKATMRYDWMDGRKSALLRRSSVQ